MNQQTITAYFDGRADADRAIERLTEAGVPRSDVTIHDASASAGTTGAEGEDKGFWASLKDLFMSDEDRYSYSEGIRRGGSVLCVRGDGVDFERVADILEDSGAVDMDVREAEWLSQGWSGYDASRMGTSAPGGATAGDAGMRTGATSDGLAGSDGTGTMGREDRLPVVEEQLRVGKREIDHGRVRVRSYVYETAVEEHVRLRDERVGIERNPVDRPATGADFEEREIEAEERAEEPVISKEARVTEEVGLRKDAEERDETIRDTVRRTDVEVEDDRADLSDEERARRRGA